MSASLHRSALASIAQNAWWAGDRRLTALCVIALGEMDTTDYPLDPSDYAPEGCFYPSQAEAQAQIVATEAARIAAAETQQRIKESTARIIADMERLAETEPCSAKHSMQHALDLERERLLAPRLAARLHAELDASELDAAEQEVSQ